MIEVIPSNGEEKGSHVDHGFSKAQMDWVLEQCSGETSFFIKKLVLPDRLGKVPCALYGPLMGDKPVTEDMVHYVCRGDRKYTSRCMEGQVPQRMVSEVTIIAGPWGDKPMVLYTMFGGPLTPKELNDPNLREEEKEEAAKVWAEHALAWT